MQGNNDNDKTDRIEIEATRSPSGGIVFPVPTSPLPPSECLVFAHTDADNTAQVRDIVLTMPRSLVTDYAEWLARTDAIDREPTTDEVNYIMQRIGTTLALAQVEILQTITRHLIKTLGDGDRSAAIERVIVNMAAEEARGAAKAESLTPEQAAARAQAMETTLRALRDRWNAELDRIEAEDNDETTNEEGNQ